MILGPLLLLTFCHVTVAKYQNEDELRDGLMTHYNKRSLPSKNTTVSLGFAFLHIDVDELKHSLKLNVWTKMSWYDRRLTWNASDFSEKLIIFPRDEIWHPDIALYNNAEAKNFNHFADSPMHVTNGTVLWVPPTTLDAQCIIDTTYWPHDVQSCTAKFGSWVYSGLAINLVAASEPIDTAHLLYDDTRHLRFSDWKLLNLTLKREETIFACCPEPYVSMLIRVTLERAAPAYYWLVQVPVVVMSLLTMTVFLLPPTSGEKIFLGGVGLLINLFFMLEVTHVIGHAPTHTPLILKLIVNQLLMTLTSVIVSVLVLRLSKEPHSGGVPILFKRPLMNLTAFLFLNNYRDSVMNMQTIKHDESPMIEAEFNRGISVHETQTGRERNEWLLLGAAVDRIFLIIYCFTFFVNVFYFCRVL